MSRLKICKDIATPTVGVAFAACDSPLGVVRGWLTVGFGEFGESWRKTLVILW